METVMCGHRTSELEKRGAQEYSSMCEVPMSVKPELIYGLIVPSSSCWF